MIVKIIILIINNNKCQINKYNKHSKIKIIHKIPNKINSNYKLFNNKITNKYKYNKIKK